MTLIKLKEHESFTPKDSALISSLGVNLKGTPIEGGTAPVYLGIDSKKASYFVGAAWLSQQKGVAITVTPHLANIDFMQVFIEVLKGLPSMKAREYFAQFYSIDFTKKLIPNAAAIHSILSPLFILQYICLIEELLRRGLKKGYILREQNFKAKLKGRLLFSPNIRTNISRAHPERNYCRYEEYTTDIVENRLLKKALIASLHMLYNMEGFKASSDYKEIVQRLNKCLWAFTGVSGELTTALVRNMKHNKLYKHYSDALNIARKILEYSGSCLTASGASNGSTPEFYINMPLLYEVYVYTKLYEAYGDDILFQAPGSYGTKADYIQLSQKLIMDAKYKACYDANKKASKIEKEAMLSDLRQLSLYARDNKLLIAMGIKDNAKEEGDYIPSCVIIYPVVLEGEEAKAIRAFDPSKKILCQGVQALEGYYKFYKLACPLPSIKAQS